MERSDPLVSIVMPAFNSESYVDEAIESVLAQTYANWELLLCDDGSTDGTRRKLRNISDGRVKYMGDTSGIGAFAAKNFLIGKATGEFITFLDSDDYMDSRRIELQVGELLRYPNLGMVGCQVANVDRAGSTIRISSKPIIYDKVLESILHSNVMGDASMMIRRDILMEVGGGFRGYFGKLSYQDYDLSLLIAEKHPCYSLPEVLYFYRQHNTSISKVLSVDRVLAKEIVVHLARQRRDRGEDDLMLGRPDSVDAYFDTLRKPYLADRSLIFREYAANYMYGKLFGKAIRASAGAVMAGPFRFENWRTLQYCLRVSILGK